MTLPMGLFADTEPSGAQPSAPTRWLMSPSMLKYAAVAQLFGAQLPSAQRKGFIPTSDIFPGVGARQGGRAPGGFDEMERSPVGEPQHSVLPLGDGRVRLQSRWPADPEQVELIEEFQIQGRDRAIMTLRKWRMEDRLKGMQPWLVEFGQAPGQSSAGMISENASNPAWHAFDTPDAWEWHVTNIPYPKETYSVSVNQEEEKLVLRTTNRKFFKRWNVPAMRRAGVSLDEGAVSFDHQNTTLVIRYEKPESEMSREREHEQHVIQLLQKGMGGSGSQGREASEGDAQPECRSS